ncbi:MAG: 30S ribosomal protein S2 [Parcubacteria group bacterium GW2011_GWA1_47_8]|nr:MAG: 30S ribosomal protein S2 [Parcubacteria group bacterium GW2011_GWA1_47_8]KKW07563.1 MAG: 30S ribosomal protein S2 [Parcubacteria group bacterium GW2011_GWA2_49_16]
MSKTVENQGIITEMFSVGAHFGYSRSRRHPSVKPFIFGSKNGVEILDLEKTSVELALAKEFVKTFAKGGKQILFVGTKNEAKKAVLAGALAVDMPFVVERWVGGILTNFPEIKKRVALLEDLLAKREKGELAMYTKKERLLIDKDIERLERNFAGIISMKELPSVLFIVDPKKESIAVKEAQFLKIPIIALASSDCNFKEVDYVIPGNDSSVSSISFFVGQIVSAFKEGRASAAQVQ